MTLLEPKLGFVDARCSPVQPRTRPGRTRPLRVRRSLGTRHAGNRRAHRKRLRRHRLREQRDRGRTGPRRPDHLLGRPLKPRARQQPRLGLSTRRSLPRTRRTLQHRAVDTADLVYGCAVQLDGRPRVERRTGQRTVRLPERPRSAPQRTRTLPGAAVRTDDQRPTDPGSRNRRSSPSADTAASTPDRARRERQTPSAGHRSTLGCSQKRTCARRPSRCPKGCS